MADYHTDVFSIRNLVEITPTREDALHRFHSMHGISIPKETAYSVFHTALEKKYPSQINAVVAQEDDYHGEHEAPDASNGKPMWDLRGIYPEDVYTNAVRMYGSQHPADSEAASIISRAKGRRDQQVTIYRAVPKDAKGGIKKGDWVAITRTYAKEHGEDNLRGNYKIIKKLASAKDLFSTGDSLQEWGYDPQPYTPKNQRDLTWEKFPGSFLKKVEADTAVHLTEIPSEYKHLSVIARGNTSIILEKDPKTIIMITRDAMKKDWLHFGLGIAKDFKVHDVVAKNRAFKDLDLFSIEIPKLFKPDSTNQAKIRKELSFFNKAKNVLYNEYGISSNKLKENVDKLQYFYEQNGMEKSILMPLFTFLLDYYPEQWAWDIARRQFAQDADGNLILLDPIVDAELMGAMYSRKPSFAHVVKAKYQIVAATSLSTIEHKVKEFLQKFFPQENLPMPKLKIVNQLSSRWLGRTSFTSKEPDTTTIEIQKRITGDQTSLEKVLAHELIHHWEFLRTPIPTSKSIYVAQHGKTFFDWAKKINTIMGKDFITETSNMSYVIENDKEFFLLITPGKPFGAPEGSFGYNWAINLSTQQKEKIKKRKEKDAAKLFKTKDSRYFAGAKIARFSGISVPKDKETQEMLKELYENGKTFEI